MANDRKGYKVSATVIPVNDLIPVADSNDIAGNLMYFGNLADINNIPITKRKLGMFVYVNAEGKHYKLIDNKPVLDNDCWEEYELISKKYVDETYAKKADIPTVPDVSNFMTKEEFEELTASIPKIQNKSFDIDENTTYPITFEIELPEGASVVQVNATAEVEEVSGGDSIVGVDYTTNPVTGNGLTTNEFGIALAGSATPTTADFVTYGE